MEKQKYYISSDQKFFYTQESRDLYDSALKSGDDPLEKIEMDHKVLFNDDEVYVYIKEDSSINFENNEMIIYSAGPLWNGTVYAQEFADKAIAEKYQIQAQDICDKYLAYIRALLPQITISGTVITKQYKDAMKKLGWTMWKEEKPQAGDVLIFNTSVIDDLSDCVSKQYYNGKKFARRSILNGDVLAWRPAPDDYPDNIFIHWDAFCEKENLVLETVEGFRKYHFGKGELGMKTIEYDEEVEEIED